MKLIKENGEVFYQVVVVLYQEQLYGQYIKDVGLYVIQFWCRGKSNFHEIHV